MSISNGKCQKIVAYHYFIMLRSIELWHIRQRQDLFQKCFRVQLPFSLALILLNDGKALLPAQSVRKIQYSVIFK